MVAVVVTIFSSVLIPHLFPHKLLAVGTQAPSLSLDAAAGGTIDIPTAAEGRPFVLEFFETSCPVCQHEVPAVCDLARTHPDVKFFGVNAARETASAVQQFRRQQGGGCITFPLLIDLRSDALRRYTVTVVPTVYLVDVHGRVAYAGTGAGGVEGLKTAIAALQRD